MPSPPSHTPRHQVLQQHNGGRNAQRMGRLRHRRVTGMRAHSGRATRGPSLTVGGCQSSSSSSSSSSSPAFLLASWLGARLLLWKRGTTRTVKGPGGAWHSHGRTRTRTRTDTPRTHHRLTGARGRGNGPRAPLAGNPRGRLRPAPSGLAKRAPSGTAPIDPLGAPRRQGTAKK